MTDLRALHNELAPEIVRTIVKPILTAGGDFKDILILLESVTAGVVAFVGNGHGDEHIIDQVAGGAKERVESMRAMIKRMMN